MPVSSNTLFHFTKKNNLLSIFEDNFKPNFCIESINLQRNEKIDLGIPMVSFCDIPLSQIKNHVKRYGNYGIGMKKEWGKRWNLNSVFYIDSNPFIINSIIEQIGKLKNKLAKKENKNTMLILPEFYQLCFAKPCYISVNYRKKYSYYNEREWRYIPNGYPICLNIDKIYLSDLSGKYARINRLLFDFDDIKYVIIKSQSEINGFINKVM